MKEIGIGTLIGLVAIVSAFIGFVLGGLTIGQVIMYILSKISINRLGKAVEVALEDKLSEILDEPDKKLAVKTFFAKQKEQKTQDDA